MLYSDWPFYIPSSHIGRGNTSNKLYTDRVDTITATVLEGISTIPTAHLESHVLLLRHKYVICLR